MYRCFLVLFFPQYLTKACLRSPLIVGEVKTGKCYIYKIFNLFIYLFLVDRA